MTDELHAAIAGVFDEVADRYDHVDADFFGQFGRRLVALAGLKPGWRVLDVGCGRGAVLFPAAEAVAPGGEVLGVDLAPAMVSETAAEVARRGLDRVFLQVLDAQTLPGLPDSGYDAVLSSLVIFFLADPLAALRRWHDLLRPGGRLALATFAGEDYRFKPAHEALRAYLPPGPPLKPPSSELFESSDAVNDLIRSAGFSDVGSVERVHQTVFSSPEHWWRWQNSHGGWAATRLIPAELREEAGRAACAALEPLRQADGSLLLEPRLRYTVADKPR